MAMAMAMAMEQSKSMMKIQRAGKISQSCRIFSILMCTFTMAAAQGKDIELDPSIRVGMGYSDNIDLDHTNEKESVFGVVAPRIRFSKDGARVKSYLDYTLTGLLYASESDLNDLQHRLYANALSEIVENSIFLDLNATVTQELLNNNRNASSDGISGSENLTETYTYKIAPSWIKSWGNLVDSELKYNYNDLSFKNSSRSDSVGQKATLSLASGKAFNQYFWNFDYVYEDVDYDTSRDSNGEAYKILLGYHYSRKLDFTYTTGYEDYSDGRSDRDDNGTGWRVGVVWNPRSRTSLTAEVGHRFFGTTYLLDFRHQGRRLIWHFKYDDTITDSRTEIISNGEGAVTNPDGTVTPLSNFNSLYYLSRRFVGDVSYQLKKSTFTLGAYQDRRYYSDSDRKDEEDIGINLGWGLKLARRTNMHTGISVSKLDNKLTRNTQRRTSLNLTLSHQLTQDMSGDLRLSYRDNSADIIRDEYTENAISVNLTKRF